MKYFLLDGREVAQPPIGSVWDTGRRIMLVIGPNDPHETYVVDLEEGERYSDWNTSFMIKYTRVS